MELIAIIDDERVARKILSHLGLPVRAPPRAPPWRPKQQLRFGHAAEGGNPGAGAPPLIPD